VFELSESLIATDYTNFTDEKSVQSGESTICDSGEFRIGIEEITGITYFVLHIQETVTAWTLQKLRISPAP